MLEFQEKRKVKRFLYSRITLVILLIILVLILRGVLSVYEKQQFTKENLDKVRNDWQSLEVRQQKLMSEINWLKTQGGTEAEIREKYGLAKPGEEVITIVDRNIDEAVSPTDERSFWQKVWNWLQ